MDKGGAPPLHQWFDIPHSRFLGSDPLEEGVQELPLEGGGGNVIFDTNPPPSSSQEEFRSSPPAPPQSEPPSPPTQPKARPLEKEVTLKLVLGPQGWVWERQEEEVPLDGTGEGAVWRGEAVG